MQARNKTKGYRLLILDGHNYCSYKFLSFAQAHNIIILCLPSHTTHVLQPCDVGVFGPLAIHWKSEVLLANRHLVSITKNNLLRYYSNARIKAFKKETIVNAWRKTGIYSFDRDALDPAVFEPALNTTTQPAQPMPTSAPPLDLAVVIIDTVPDTNPNPVAVEQNSSLPVLAASENTPISNQAVIPSAPTLSSQEATMQEPPSQSISIRLLIPPVLPITASRADLWEQNTELHRLLRAAEYQIQRDDAQKRLMDLENGQLHQRLFSRKQKKADVRVTSEARHLTKEQVLIEKGLANWRARMKLINQSLKPRFKIQRDKIDAKLKEQIPNEKRVDDARKKALQLLKLQRVEDEKEAGKWRREMAGLAKGLQDVADADVKKEAKRIARLEKAVLKRPAVPHKKKAAVAAVADSEDDSEDDTVLSVLSHPPSPVKQKQRPRPRPIKRAIAATAPDITIMRPTDLESGDVSELEDLDGDDSPDTAAPTIPPIQPAPSTAGPSHKATPALPESLPTPRYPLRSRH